MKKYGILLLTTACLTSALSLVLAAETESLAVQTAPTVEAAKPETMIQKAENAIEQAGEKVEKAAEKVKEEAEKSIEGKKAEPVKAEEKSEAEEEEKEAKEEAQPEEAGEITVEEGVAVVPEMDAESALLRACVLHCLARLNQAHDCYGPNCFFHHPNASSPILWHESIGETLPNYCIGVLTAPVPEVLGTHFGLKSGEGLWVEFVVPGSPAAEAGIHRGDILLQAAIACEKNGEKIRKVFWLNHPILFMDLVDQIGPEEMELTTICSGKEQKISLKPVARKELMKKVGIIKE